MNMQYIRGNIWDIAATEVDSWIVVTTNTMQRSDGSAIMGAGLAKQAMERCPTLEKELGNHITRFGERLYIGRPYICLPTKRNWRDKSHLDLIEKGCHELADFARILSSLDTSGMILVPKLGCGLGGLNWEREVCPIVDSILVDSRFMLVN